MRDLMEKLLLRVRRGTPLALLVLVVVLMAGCAPITPEAPAAASDAVPIPDVTISVVDGKLVLPDEIPGGIVHFTFEGTNPDSAIVDIGRLAEGATVEALESTLPDSNDNPGPALELVHIFGMSGMTNEVFYDLTPGNYVAVLNAGATPDMDTDLVTFTPGPDSGAAAPVADVSVELNDFAFTMPDKIAAGPQLWEISNTGQQWHMLLIMGLAEGQTIDDVFAMMMSEDDSAGTLPDIVGDYTPISQGNRAWVTMDIPPGTYTVMCPLPDIMGDMTPHAMMGMVRELTVE